eukprot:4034655-Heterocapsa_arctica.AAC.1
MSCSLACTWQKTTKIHFRLTARGVKLGSNQFSTPETLIIVRRYLSPAVEYLAWTCVVESGYFSANMSCLCISSPQAAVSSRSVFLLNLESLLRSSAEVFSAKL